MRKSLLYMICSVLLLTSCHYKDLEESEIRYDMRVVFQWDECPEAQPKGMLFYIFAADAMPASVPFADIHGGPVVLQKGTYQLMAYNDGTELQSRGTTWQDFELYPLTTSLSRVSDMFANSRAPLAQATENQPVVEQPDSLETASLNDYAVDPSRENVITFMMHEATKTYRFIIKDVTNLQYVTSLMATLSGMSESWLPGPEHCSDTECLIPFDLEKTGESSMAGSVRTFGHCPVESNLHSHYLTIYCEMENGQKYYYVVDVTELVHQTEHWDGGDIPIVISGLPLPDPVPAEEGGGFQPNVDEWNEVVIEVEL